MRARGTALGAAGVPHAARCPHAASRPPSRCSSPAVAAGRTEEPVDAGQFWCTSRCQQGRAGLKCQPQKDSSGGEWLRPLRQESDSGAILVIPSQGTGQPAPGVRHPPRKPPVAAVGSPETLSSLELHLHRTPGGSWGGCPSPWDHSPLSPWGLPATRHEAPTPSRPVGTPPSPSGPSVGRE